LRRADETARTSADAAQAAAQATRDTVLSMDTTAERQLRAYITVDSHGIRPFRTGNVSIARIGVRNVGQIPANDVRWFMDAKVSTDGRLQDFPITDEFYGRNLTIQPHAEMVRSQSINIVENEYMDIRNRKAFLYIWGKISYIDGFHKPRFTLFCHRYDGYGIKRPDPNDVTSDGHQFITAESMRYHQYGNDAD
jgi:hypothetical protein